MKIELNHTIIPAHDKTESAKFFGKIFGLKVEESDSHFECVHLNESLVFLFDNYTSFESHHYAFKVGEEEFDAIFGRVKAEGLAYGSGPRSQDDMKINHWNGGRGVYFHDPNGHSLELMTA